MTRARDLADSADKDIAGTLTLDGLVVDDITIDGSTISDGGDFTIDSGGDIILDANGADWKFKDDGTDVLNIENSSGDIKITSITNDKDIIFRGVDNGSAITALTLDMSDAGSAYFNNKVGIGTSSNRNSTKLDVLGDITFGENANYYGTLAYNAGEGFLDITSGDGGFRLFKRSGPTELTRIDSSGRLLHGKTSTAFSVAGHRLDADGNVEHIRDGNPPLNLNRKSSDGDIAVFYKDGTTVGSIGVKSSRPYFINNTNFGIRLANNALVATDESGTNESSASDLGASDVKWKDFYLSGVVYVADTTGNPVGNHNPGIMLNPTNGSHFHRDGGNPVRVGTSVDGNLTEYYKEGALKGFIAVNGNDFIISGPSAVSGIAFNSNGLLPALGGTVSDNTEDIGQADLRYDDIHATNGTIQTSDRNEKQDIAELTDAEQKVAVAAKGLLRKFRWKDKVAEKGDKARTHFGIIAQDLQAAFEAEGLDAGDYAMFISSTWTDEETGEERTRMGVRYSELLAFIIAAI